jgi:hypothetical protein
MDVKFDTFISPLEGKHRLTLCLRIIFGPRVDQVIERYEKLHDLYSCTPNVLGNEIKEEEKDGTCSTHGGHKRRIRRFAQKASREEITLNIHVWK